MKSMTKLEAAKFLTKNDLEKLLVAAEAGKLEAPMTGGNEPVVIVREQMIPLFTVLELIGAE